MLGKIYFGWVLKGGHFLWVSGEELKIFYSLVGLGWGV